MCCGGFLEQAGYERQLRKSARENADLLQAKGYKKIITNCPLCYNIFKSYKTLLPNFKMEAEFVLTTILNALRANPRLARGYFSEPVAYYDSCYLARHSELINEPRELLGLLGYKIMELNKNREETLCCGSCGGLTETNPELARRIASDFIKILKREKIRKIVTADARAYRLLTETLLTLNIPESEIQVLEFSDLVCSSLGITPD